MKIEVLHEGQDYFAIEVTEGRKKKVYEVNYLTGMMIHNLLQVIIKTLNKYN